MAKRLTALSLLEHATPASALSGFLKVFPGTADLLQGIDSAGLVQIFPMQQLVIKGSDESVNASTTPQDDDELFITDLEINSTFIIGLMIIYTSVTATPDLKIGFTIPTSSTWKWCPRALQVGATTANDNINRALYTGTANTSADSPGTIITANGQTVAFPIGILRTAGTAGTLRLQWAQKSNVAENTTIKADSWIMAEKVA